MPFAILYLKTKENTPAFISKAHFLSLHEKVCLSSVFHSKTFYTYVPCADQQRNRGVNSQMVLTNQPVLQRTSPPEATLTLGKQLTLNAVCYAVSEPVMGRVFLTFYLLMQCGQQCRCCGLQRKWCKNHREKMAIKKLKRETSSRFLSHTAQKIMSLSTTYLQTNL